jgi:hypothetical protein
MVGTAKSGSRAPWKETPGLKERVIKFCAMMGSYAGNAQIRQMIFEEFKLPLTLGMVAGAVHSWGILRGHPRWEPIAEPGFHEDILRVRRARHREHQNLSPEEKEAKRLARVAAAIERRKEYEANRERKARTDRQVNPQRSIPSGPKVDAAAMARHDQAMARPALAQRPARVHPVSQQPIEIRPAVYGRVIECQTVTNTGSWGIGIEWCGKPSKPGKPYCEECCRAYYVPAPKSRSAHAEA